MTNNPSFLQAVCPHFGRHQLLYGHRRHRNSRRPLFSRFLFVVIFVISTTTTTTTTTVLIGAAVVVAADDNNNNIIDESTNYNHYHSSQPQSTTRPPSIIEAEARTARDLRKTLTKVQQELASCQSRNTALSDGFQDLYKTHLENVESLRKCKEGVLTHEEISKFHTDDEESYSSSTDSFTSSLLNNIMMEQQHGDNNNNNNNNEQQQQYLSLISHLETSVNSLIRREKTWERTISELVARRDLLEKREGAWERTISDLMGEVEVRAKRERWWMDMKKDMEGRIQALCHLAVLERFGPGPHYISIRVALDERNPSSIREIIVQLAPLDLMPHSIHLFLTQISEGYWNVGTPAFVLNAEHVLQACPHPCLERMEFGGTIGWSHGQKEPYQNMKRAGLDTVSFQEYSTMVPHEKYTIGFAGRPHSGPEFYINLMDNTLDHGTLEERKYYMGPTKYAAWTKEVLGRNGVILDVGEGEMLVDVDAMVAIEPYPCFGKVIDGFEVVDEIARGMTRATIPKREVEEEGFELDPNLLLQPVHITSISILKDYQPDNGRAGAKIEL